MLCKSLMIKTDRNTLEVWKIVCKSDILAPVHLLVLLCELSEDVCLS
jgi:hypothetical protein